MSCPHRTPPGRGFFQRQIDRCLAPYGSAWWSGPSRQGFAKLKQVLAALDPGGRLELVVVDTDGCPDLYECPEFVGQLHGWGEVAWVRDGRVVRTWGMGYHPECFEPFTTELLAIGPDAEPGAAAD